MKICVCSDSHGNTVHLMKILSDEKPDLLLFLGDGLRDLDGVAFPDGCIVYRVRGNCDFIANEPELRLLTVKNFRILMVHGHKQGVKSDLLRLGLLAAQQKADIVVYGHTHIPAAQREGERLYLCPGSVGGAAGAYLILTIADGGVRYEQRSAGQERQ